MRLLLLLLLQLLLLPLTTGACCLFPLDISFCVIAALFVSRSALVFVDLSFPSPLTLLPHPPVLVSSYTNLQRPPPQCYSVCFFPLSLPCARLSYSHRSSHPCLV